jgi:hypothetical protein
MGFFPYMGEILWGFLTFMEVFPIPPLSRGRSGGGWDIYVAVVLRGANYSLHSPRQVIARSDSGEAISKRDCHALWARNDTFFVAPNVTYFVLSVIIKSIKMGIVVAEIA